MRRLLIVVGILFAAARLAAAPAPTATAARDVRLTILYTGDLHGRVHPIDALADADLGEGLARVAASVKAIRAEGRPVLLLDSGDTIQGSPEQALAFASGKDAIDPIIAAMNLMGYDAMTVGNHEFDFGVERLDASQRQAKFPWLSANTLMYGDRQAFPPYVVKQIEGVRVGILGLTTTGTPNWVSPSLLEGLRFVQPLSVASHRVSQLREQERCDFVIVLTHQGFERDPKTGEPRGGASGENQAYALATKVPGVDLVLSGHAHVVVAPQRVGATWVAAPGRWGEALIRIDAVFEKPQVDADARWRVAGLQGKSLPMKNVVPDPGVVGAVAPAHEAAMKILAAKLAELAAPASTGGAKTRMEDSGIVDWLHRVQLAETKADLSFASPLAFRPVEWAAGPLSMRQVWQFYPYENSLVTVRATGKIVREALERSAECISDPDERPRSCDSLEGAEYEIDLSRPPRQRVVFLRRGGRDVRDDDVFTVALNSHRASGGGGYGMWKRAEKVSEKGNVRQMLVSDARAHPRLTLEPTRNWKVTGARAPRTSAGREAGSESVKP
ncbi:MAG: bifunctional UDP-sugar hydrolase/5'-nucleotidase [Thermoanaerobaculia bacterium]